MGFIDIYTMLPNQDVLVPLSFMLLFSSLNVMPPHTHWGPELGRLLVKCEKCGSLYPSGIVAEFEDVKRKLREFNLTATTTCPHCGYQNPTAYTKLVLRPTMY